MIRALIIDDMQIKSDYLSVILGQVYGDDVQCFFATGFHQACLNLTKKFDIVLCDHFLGDDDNHGVDFVLQYTQNWPDAFVRLYSADADDVNESMIQGIKCYSFESVQTEIYKSKEYFKPIVEKIAETLPQPQPQPISTQEVAKDMKTFVPMIGIVFTLLAGAVGYGKLANTTDTTKQGLAIHCTNQMKEQSELSKALIEFACATTELRTEVRNLKTTVDKLQDEIKRQ